MSLVKTMVDDVMDEGGAMEQHPLIGMVVIGPRNLSSTVNIPLPHLSIHHSLNLKGEREGGYNHDLQD